MLTVAPYGDTRQKILDVVRNLLDFAQQMPKFSYKCYVLRNPFRVLPHLLYALGSREGKVAVAAEKFLACKCEELWNEVISTVKKNREKLINNPRVIKQRSSVQRNKMTLKFARANNLSKANQTATSKSSISITAETLAVLHDLHPHGSLEFNRDHWPSAPLIQDYWDSDDGREVLEKYFAIKQIRRYLNTRPAYGAFDVDRWRGREHMVMMFMNDDDTLNEQIRNEIILPYILGDIRESHCSELAGTHLIALERPGKPPRPIACPEIDRRCAASLAAEYCKSSISDVCLFVCLYKTRKSILRSLCFEGSNNPWEWLHTESGAVAQKLIRHGPRA